MKTSISKKQRIAAFHAAYFKHKGFLARVAKDLNITRQGARLIAVKLNLSTINGRKEAKKEKLELYNIIATFHIDNGYDINETMKKFNVRAGYVYMAFKRAKNCSLRIYKHKDKQALYQGKVFGRLTLLERKRVTAKDKTSWICICSCGNSREISERHIFDGRTKSCGCIKKGRKPKNNKQDML